MKSIRFANNQADTQCNFGYWLSAIGYARSAPIRGAPRRDGDACASCDGEGAVLPVRIDYSLVPAGRDSHHRAPPHKTSVRSRQRSLSFRQGSKERDRLSVEPRWVSYRRRRNNRPEFSRQESSVNWGNYQTYPYFATPPPPQPPRLRPSRLSWGNWQNRQLVDLALLRFRPAYQEEPPSCRSPAQRPSVRCTRSLQQVKRTGGYLALTLRASLHSSTYILTSVEQMKSRRNKINGCACWLESVFLLLHGRGELE